MVGCRVGRAVGGRAVGACVLLCPSHAQMAKKRCEQFTAMNDWCEWNDRKLCMLSTLNALCTLSTEQHDITANREPMAMMEKALRGASPDA